MMKKNRRTSKASTSKLPKHVWLSAIFGILLGLVATGAALLLVAWLIKAFSIGDGLFSVLNMIIKLAGIFITVLFVGKRVPQKNFFVGAVMGPLYILASFLLFLVLGGSFVSLKTLLLDLLTGVAGGVLFGAITSGMKKA